MATTLTLLAGLFSLTGCGSSQIAAAAAAAGGRAGTISQDVIDNEARPPKQVVYRFDDHRYIENDPSGGFVGGCQGELYCVDEKLGIRTRAGGNKKNNPTGLFKVDSPCVVTRDEQSVWVSFDQGRTFIHLQIGGGADIAVQGDKMYVGGGSAGRTGHIDSAFEDYAGILLNRINAAERRVDPIYESNRANRDLTADAPYLLAARTLKPTQFFQCKDLPWRPSARREREGLNQQQQDPSKP